ncbi:MAG: VWA domain-containing protein [Myxococcota bacterium]
MTFGFERPDLLWLLLALPAFWGFAFQSRRRLARGRLLLLTVVRSLLVGAVVLALAELTLRRPVDDLAVSFVVDRSASVGPTGQAQALSFVQSAVSTMSERDEAAVVVFGADAQVDRDLGEELTVPTFESRPNPNQTDIAGGLRLGTAVLPADRTRRVVLITDGEQTRGDAATQALIADDTELYVVSLAAQMGADVWLDDVLAPAEVDEGGPFDLRVVVRSDVDTEGVVRLYNNERYLGQRALSLKGGGATSMTVSRPAGEPGLQRFRAVVEVPEGVDARPQNNQGVTTVRIAGKPTLLVVATDLAASAPLVRVLRAQGLEVDSVDTTNLPPTLSDLRSYAGVVLVNVPSYAVARPTQQALESYVRDLGRGLLMIGGDTSFGVGGWFASPVERTLPVRMDISDKAQLPQLAMIIALDKSCSMGGYSGSSKIDLAKEAALQTAALLSDRDMLGLLSFDAASSWISPLEPMAGRRGAFENDVGSLRAGGGTDIYPAVKTAIGALKASPAALKHIIVISDGMTTPGDYQGLISPAHRDHDITLTAVTIGSDADQGTMRDLAQWGGGQSYLAVDKSSIPAIFTRETLLARRSFLVEEPFTPQIAGVSDLLQGVEPGDVPVLQGYVTTEAKPRSVVAMTTQSDPPAPLLAHWRYGLGRAVAFTSDAGPRWSQGWVGTESYTQFWTQVGRWLVSGAGDKGVQLSATIEEGHLVVSADAFTPAGGFANFLTGQARVVAPDLSVHNLDLRQVGPGRYQARWPVDQDGSWLVGVQLSKGDQVVGQAVTEAVQPYSPEFRRSGSGPAVLRELAGLGQGGFLTDPARVFEPPEVLRTVPWPLWPWLVGLAGVLLLADVAVRRLQLAKAMGETLAAVTSGGPPRWPARLTGRRTPAARSAVSMTEEGPEEVPTAPEPPPVPVDSYAGRLLAARKKARDKLDVD